MSSNSQIIPGFTAEQSHAFTNILLPALQVVLRQAIDKHFDPLQPQQEQEQKHKPLQQANVEKTTEKIAETVISSSDTTGLLSTVSHQSIQSATQPATQSATQPEHSVEQEEEPLQAIAENTAEKPSGNKATVIKNTAQLSKILRQIATQKAENDTTIWPAISIFLGNITLVWHITAMSEQEKDLCDDHSHITMMDLYRQGSPIGRCIFGRIETVRCLTPPVISLFERFHCGRRTRGIHTTN
ncbi:hypothetical protein HO173_008253 [Letharia columbiana]|uniref:Uncharacterized protein n=1 Tax=Letharia columbiana TaxID=112416 RepID=A0A8H6L2W3_9LECA|nr:uncharacterized protein HO173_008253 [Letharia columbiana]KAF6233522.1 hypothetical protein HO173_008253 [Letharia columbiana]